MQALSIGEGPTRRVRAFAATILVSICVPMWLACATPPNPKLVELRQSYEEAQADPVVSENAPVPLYEAGKTVARAEEAWEEGDEEKADHLAYLASRRIELARITAQTAVAQKEFDELDRQRGSTRLAVRTQEAELARKRAALEAERAERAERALQAMQAKKTERGSVLTLGDVLFDFGKATLNPGARTILDRLARFLADNPERRAIIEGHTDSVGSDEFNLQLSQARADSVAAYLEGRGIAASRLQARGLGKTLPVASNATEAGRQQNRRVEIIIPD